ncbi:MAG: hypothetical protein OEX97_13555, partial [Acidimicrobiia bacterium]|nr:hypothetical protein [Acidimicrobiia bacterium]
SSRLLWLPVGGTIGIFLSVLMMLSRPEIALYRSMGVTRSGVVVVSALGYFLIALWSLAIGVLAAGLVLDDLGPGGAALLVGVRSGIAAFLVAVFCLAAGALFAQRGSISQMLKLRSG